MTSTMKKQFFRFKQVADQTFARAEKSEVLSEELQEAERKVESIKNTLHRMCKDLKDTLHGQGTDGVALNKRMRKMPEFLLATGLMENSQTLGKDSVLGQTLAIYGESEKDISSKRLEYEVCCEKLVIQPLKHIIDVEINEITKQRRALHKHVLDMDAAKARYTQAVRHSQPTGSTGPSTANKLDSSREEMEEAQTKMEQCRDALITEIFQLLARETEIASRVVDLVEAQKKYHQQALGMLETIVPDLQNTIKTSGAKPVFGQPLGVHLESTGREIAYPLEHCVQTLIHLGLQEEGLFRVAGGASKVKKIKTVFDAGLVDPSSMDEYSDPHVVSSVLKSYLRELPEPLLTESLYEEWMKAAKSDPDERIKCMHTVVSQLPAENYNNLRYMIRFLAHLARHKGTTRMNSQNLAIVIAPNLIWDPKDDPSNPVSMNMSIANMHSIIVDNLVSNADYFFPGEDEFVTMSPKPVEEVSPLVNGPSVTVNGPSPASPRKETPSPGAGSVHKRVGSTGSWSHELPTSLQAAHSSNSLTDPPKLESSCSESPRPTTRRKNKPAPIPPVVKSDSGGSPTVSEEASPVSTLDRQSKEGTEASTTASNDQD